MDQVENSLTEAISAMVLDVFLQVAFVHRL